MSTRHWITSGPTITSTTPAFVIPYVLTKPSALRRFWLVTLLQEPVCCQGIRSHVCHTHGDHLSTRASSDVNTERHVSWLIPGTLDLLCGDVQAMASHDAGPFHAVAVQESRGF